MWLAVRGCLVVVCGALLSLLTPFAYAEKWVYEGAILSARGPSLSRATLQAGIPTVPKNFTPQKLVGDSVLLSDISGAHRSFSARGEEIPKAYSRKNNPCKRAKVRRVLSSIPGRVRCEPNYAQFASTTPNDPLYDPNYVNSFMSLESAWNYSTGNNDIVVVVVDTGVLYTHPDLADNIWINPNEIAGNGIDDDGNNIIDDVYGVNAITWSGPAGLSSAGNPLDDNGHGTHCAGIIGAKGNNGQGVAGVNWNVKIAAAKFLSSTGSGSTSNAIKAIQYATILRKAGHKVALTSNSWGGSGYSQALLDAIQAGANEGILFVAAAGNSTVNTDYTPFYPAGYSSNAVVAVASTDQTGGLSYFSNYGATSVDIAAPGSNIVSTYLNNGYASASGTSMAAPQVSGVAALAQAICANRTPLSVSQLRNALLTTGTTSAGLSGKVASSAIVNAFGAVQAAASACGAQLPTTPSATPTRTSTPTSSPTINPTAPTSGTVTGTPTSSPALSPTAPSSPSETAIPTATAQPTETSTQPTITPNPEPSGTETPAPSKTPTLAITPTFEVSPTEDLDDGSSISLSINGPASETKVKLRVFGTDGRWTYSCPSILIPLTNGSASRSINLPTTPHRLKSIQMYAVINRKTLRQQLSFTAPISTPNVRLGVKYMTSLCNKFASSVSPQYAKRRIQALRVGG